MTRDFSRLTNEELFAIAGQQPRVAQVAAPAQDLSTLSEEELFAMAGQQPVREPSFLERFGRAGIPQGGTGLLPSREAFAPIGEAALEIGPGLGELAVGAVQRGAEVLGQEEFSGRLGEQQAREREGLTTAQRTGRVAGQIIGTAPIAAGGALLPGIIKGAGAVSALTPTEEGTAEAAVKQIGIGVTAGLATLGIIKGTGAAVNKAKEIAQSSIKGVKAGTGARNIQELTDETINLKEKASSIYDALRETNADLAEKAGARIITGLDDALITSGKLNARLHGDTLSVVRGIRAEAKAGKITLEGLDQQRQLLNQVVQKNTDTIGSVNPDGLKAQILINKLDDSIEKLSPSDLNSSGTEAIQLLTQARKEWKVFKKFQRITNIVEKADGDANKTKAAFKRFVNNKKNLRGFTAQEQEALKRAAKSNTAEDVLKSLGKFGFDASNTALPVLSVLGGTLAGSPGAGVATVASGTIARKLQKLVANGKVEDALTLIQEGGVDVAEVITKIPSKKVQQELLTRLLSVGAAQQSIQ